MAAASRSIAACISSEPIVLGVATGPGCDGLKKRREGFFKNPLAVLSVLVVLERCAPVLDRPQSRFTGGGADSFCGEESGRRRAARLRRQIPLGTSSQPGAEN